MFNAEKETERIVEFIREYYSKNNLGGAVLGISGGKDSAVVAALFVKALGAENVVGVTLPCHSKDEDKEDAKLISDYYGFKLLNVDLTNVFDAFKNEISKIGDFTEEQTKNSDINIKPRFRMSTCYYLAALMSAVTGKTYLVAGTSNKSELFVGYFTKGGDSVHDIATIADLTVSEVLKVGEVLKVPEKVLYKVPSDGLSNQSDEDKLGVTYKAIEMYINNEELDEETKNKVERLHNGSRHKFSIPTYKKGE
ncbi:MAG: NAD(+) synthase [Clostridia bacterium]|nr:NAD(+) synthase [Clostridia bacterium]